MKYTKYDILTIVLILIDQAIQLAVYYTFDYEGGEVKVFGDWFKLHFITNPGMAFGIQLGGDYGKIILTVFRIIAMGFITYYLYVLAKKELPQGLLWCIAAILAGAIGNLIDSVFY